MEQMMRTHKMISKILLIRGCKHLTLILAICFSIGSIANTQSALKLEKLKKLKVHGYIQGFNQDGNLISFRPINSKLLQNYNITTNTLENKIANENVPKSKKESLQIGTSEDLNFILIQEYGRKNRAIEPLGKNDYLNVSLSPDESKILFRVSGMASYVCDLDGNVISEFQDAEFPIWISNKQVLFARVEDDGYQYKRSDLFISDLSNDNEINITEDLDLIPLYPAYHFTSKTLGFSTPEGSIYLSEML